MKTFAIAALLASVAIAQPHGHQHNGGKQHAHEHDKRELVVEIETEWVTATVIIGDGSTQTIAPTNTGGEFFEPSSTAVPVVAPQATTLIPQVAPVPAPSSSTSSPPPPAAPTPEPTPAPAPQPTTAAAVVVPPVQAPVVETPVVASTTTAAAPAQSVASSGGGGGSSGGNDGQHTKRTGEATYYDIGQGACGYDDSAENETGFIAALSADFWNSISTLTNSGVNSPSNPLCDKKVKLTANGKTVEVTARDKCPGCKGNDIDVSQAAFIALFGSTGVGRGIVTWEMSW